ncbi:hypothetical protein [Orrella sp. 11846]|uniref:hypothetical protein n=1 Tax=Orrella sp. 11846 TaxID=3409913 RepID=UPI003B5AD174
MEWIILWILLSVLVAFYASKFKRNALGWFIVSMLLSPLFGAITLLIAGYNHAEDEPQDLKTQFTSGVTRSVKSPYVWLLVVALAISLFLVGYTGGALPD